jgi:hypothetical protein
MHSNIAQPQPQHPPRERGLGYAVLGGLSITLVAALAGAIFIVWFYTVQRGPTPPELLPAETQLYVTLAPTVSDVIEAAPLEAALREQIGISNPQALGEAVQGLLGVRFSDDVVTWMRSEAAVAVWGVDPATTSDGNALLRDGNVVFLLASRNDPAATRFLEKHLTVREARGEQLAQIAVGDVTVHYTADAAPSPITAVALIEHHIMFANRPELLVAIAEQRTSGTDQLASVPAFASFSSSLGPRQPAATYGNGTASATTARDALRDLLTQLGAR